MKGKNKNDGKKELTSTHYLVYILCGSLLVMYLILKDIYPASTELTFIMCIVNLGLPLAIILLLILILGDLMVDEETEGEGK